MKLIIDIPEEMYEQIKDGYVPLGISKYLKNGIPYETVTEFADRCRECGAKYGKLLKQEPKTGHWIPSHIPESILDECSECGFSCGAFTFEYCPNCGAKMIDEQETETWSGIHAQIIAPRGTFERIFNEANDDNDI